MDARLMLAGVLLSCAPRPVLVPDQGGSLALASEGGISLVADASAWGDRWGITETLTPIAVDLRNGSARKIAVRAQDITLEDEQGRRYEVFPLGAQPSAKTNPVPQQMPAPAPQREDPVTPVQPLPPEPAPTPPSRPQDNKQPASRPRDEWVYLGGAAPQQCAAIPEADYIFTAHSGGGHMGGGHMGGGHMGGAPSHPGGGGAPSHSAPPHYGGSYRPPAQGYNYGQHHYYAPAPRYSSPRVYMGPGWGGYGRGYGYGAFSFWDPFWGPYWGARYGYGYYLYRPWTYRRPGDEVLSGMIRVALLDTTLAPQGETRGFVFFQYALDQAQVLTLRWTPHDADTDEALPPLQAVFRVARIMIEVTELSKHYQVHKREAGLGHALRSLFHRRYDTVKAVDAIDFTIHDGERVGFLGPNGAGKTTTLKMLSGLLYPTSGNVRVFGHEPSRRAREFLRSIMLVTGQKQQLIWDLPPADTFDLNRAIYKVDAASYKQTLDELVTLLGLADVMKKPTRQLSLGERMKCELAAALIHQPKVLFLDEPTIGLDITMQAVVRRFIRDYNERHGATVILTSHYMEDVAALCPRVIVINQGHIVFDGSLEGLVRQQRPEKRLSLRFSSPVTSAALQPIGQIIEHDDHRAVLQVPNADLKRAVQQALGSLPIIDFSAEDAPLEEALAALFQGAA